MLTTNQCEMKFREIREIIEQTPKTIHGKEYIAMRERLREEYNKEYIKAIGREPVPVELPRPSQPFLGTKLWKET